jgi:hypothetical protein
MERGKLNHALRQIRAVTPDVTGAMIKAAADRFRMKYRDVACTAHALASQPEQLKVTGMGALLQKIRRDTPKP